MPAKYVIIDRDADKHFLKLPRSTQQRALRAYDIIKLNPITGVKLHGELKGYFKYRLGNYRIIYSFDSKSSTVKVVAIEHRQGVYK
ncbi:MAG: hypothetical protein UT26_C0058G0009 [Microgenomates group bacterium GW2011_GWC1_39_12]|nr:MAG: hypothetical protein UT26_C0058G0009 [Microgenomates group bacterium GW2011_GWC1_39_12]